MELWHVVTRVLFGYAFALVLIRACGRRTIRHAEFSSFVVLLVIGDMFDNLFWSEISLAQFSVGAGTIALMHVLARSAACRVGAVGWSARASSGLRP